MAEEKLIDAVKQRKELYDTKDANYKKTKLRNRIWDDIANGLNLKDGEEAKILWLKLRNSYRDARRRQMKCVKSGAAPENIRPWRFQKQMMFLERFMSAGHRGGNVNDSDDDSQLSSPLPISNEILDSENVEGDNSYERITHEQSNNTDVDRDNIDESSRETTGSPTLAQTPVANSKQSKNRKQDDISLLKRSLQQRDERTKQRADENRKLESMDNLTDNPLYNFFISMYQLTRKMSPLYQHRVRSQLFQAVSKAEEEIMNIPSQPALTSTSSPYPSTH